MFLKQTEPVSDARDTSEHREGFDPTNSGSSQKVGLVEGSLCSPLSPLGVSLLSTERKVPLILAIEGNNELKYAARGEDACSCLSQSAVRKSSTSSACLCF